MPRKPATFKNGVLTIGGKVYPIADFSVIQPVDGPPAPTPEFPGVVDVSFTVTGYIVHVPASDDYRWN
jgi:hypothetical protein